jgi:hypothetical protein
MHNEGRHLNDADKMQESKDHNKPSLPDLNLGRRRMIRSAAAVAPLVLTLRSGAVAAAVSCVGVKGFGTTNPGNGNITGVSATTADTCVTNYTVCPDPAQTTKILPGNVNTHTIATAPGNNLTCGTGVDRVQGQQIAILSATSASSFLG